jgi:molecular chaperone DnaJ
MSNYYDILGVPKTATKDEIKKAYRKLAHQYHPDTKHGDEKKFKEINEAYQILGDDKKKSQYDQFGSGFSSGGGSGFGGFDFSGFGGRGFQSQEFDLGDIFSEFFGRGARTSTKTRQKGRNIQVDAVITLEEAFRGIRREFSIRKYIVCDKCGGNKNEPGTKLNTCGACGGSGEIKNTQRTPFGSFTQVMTCDTCRGEGKIPEKKCSKCGGAGRVQEIENISVEIPAGINSGEIINLEGKGEAGMGGYGNLYVRVHIKEHPYFIRDGDNIYSEAEISMPQAALGDSIIVKTLDIDASLDIPGGIESGEMLRLRGKGMPHMYGASHGDLYVKIIIKTPKRLSKRAKELLLELKREI